MVTDLRGLAGSETEGRRGVRCALAWALVQLRGKAGQAERGREPSGLLAWAAVKHCAAVLGRWAPNRLQGGEQATGAEKVVGQQAGIEKVGQSFSFPFYFLKTEFKNYFQKD